MAEKSRICHYRESGLSEVIGFVLIIGLLVVVASLYLTYGVPAQGRENEILHMNEVKDQFVEYKLSLFLTTTRLGPRSAIHLPLEPVGGTRRDRQVISP